MSSPHNAGIRCCPHNLGTGARVSRHQDPVDVDHWVVAYTPANNLRAVPHTFSASTDVHKRSQLVAIHVILT